MVVRNEPSLQDKRDVESLRLHTRDKNSHDHVRFLAHVLVGVF